MRKRQLGFSLMEILLVLLFLIMVVFSLCFSLKSLAIKKVEQPQNKEELIKPINSNERIK